MKPKKFIIVVGAESSGHHLLRDLLENFLSDKNVMHINGISNENIGKNFHIHFLNIGNPFPHPRTDKIDLNILDIKILKKKIYEELKIFNKEILYYDGSLPYGYTNRIINFPNYIKLYEILNDILEFKIIYLRRNIIDCAKSIFRRKFETNPLNASEIALKSFFVAHHTFHTLKKKIPFVEINYDKIVGGDKDCFGNLKNLLNLKDDFFDEKYEIIKKKEYPDNSPEMQLMEKYLSYYLFLNNN